MSDADGLLRLLEVDGDRIPNKCAAAVKYMQGRWEELGSPTEPKDLEEFLDKMLRFCPTVGYVYPKIYLKRLKQLQRGEWEPTVPARGERAGVQFFQ
jgi:hypothetical protein